MYCKAIVFLLLLICVLFSWQCFKIFEQIELSEEEKKLVKAAFRKNDVQQFNTIMKNRWIKNPFMNPKTEETLLHYLAWKGDNVEFFKTVAEGIGDLFETDANNETAIDIAAKKGHVNIVEYITHISFIRIKEMYEFKYHMQEEFMGKSLYQKAFLLAGENNQVQTFNLLAAHLTGVNLSHGKDKAVVDLAMKMKPKFPPLIQMATDELIELLDHDASQAKAFGDSPSEQLAQPVDKFIEEILEITAEAATANDLKKIDFVPMTEKFLKGTIEAVTKIIKSGKSSEISPQFSPKSFKALFSQILKIVSKNQKKFNVMFRQILSKSTTNVNKNRNKELVEFKNKMYNGGIDQITGNQMLDYSLELFKIKYPQSQVDKLVTVILSGDDISVSFIMSIIEDFCKSSSNNFIIYLEDNHGINILKKKKIKSEL